MKKVVLINLPPMPNYDYKNTGAIYPATGIMLIGTVMKNKGLEVRVIDGALYADYGKVALNTIDRDTALIGFSVMTSQVPAALKLSKLIKNSYPKIPIVWGGIHPILFPRETAKDPNIDIVVTGEGYNTTLDLIDFLNEKIAIEKIRGIGFKDVSGNVILTEGNEPDDIDSLPYFDYSILDDANIYLNAKSVYQREINTDSNESLRIMPLLSGLGCCYKCQFCINVFLKRKYRFRPAVSVIEEIKRLQNEYGINAFIFYDEDFLISKKRLLEFLDRIEKENLKFYWRIWARVNYFREDYLNKDLVLRMERNGLRSIVMGAESGSQRILDLIEKGISIDNIRSSANLLNSTRITPRYSFIVGIDGEEKKEVLKTYGLCLDLIDSNMKVDIAGPFIFRCYPGSPIFDRMVKKYNLILPENLYEWDQALSAEGYLRADAISAAWPGFSKTIEFLNTELYIFSRLRRVNGFFGRLLKKLIRWRVRNSADKFLVELGAFNALRAIYRLVRAIKPISVKTGRGDNA